MECVARIVTQIVLLAFVLSFLLGMLVEAAYPGTELFSLLLLTASAHLGGTIAGFFRLPPLLGMLSVGVLLRNLPHTDYDLAISVKTASALRDIALVIILLKAGLGLDVQKLKLLRFVVLRLSFLPCLLEAASLAVVGHFALDLPWIWSIMLGFIVSAVSAAVLVPGIQRLEERGLGAASGIPTLVLASVSLDNILALTGFVVSFNVLTSRESLSWTLVKRLLEPAIGLVVGAVLGIVLWYIPRRANSSVREVTCYRVLLLCFGGLGLEFLSKRLDVSGAGALSCVSLAFVASIRWKRDEELFETITWICGTVWFVLEPVLFGLIGAGVTWRSLGNNAGYGLLVLFSGVLVRCGVTLCALQASSLDFREKLFVSGSWLAKATVQAAVGSQALDYGRSNDKGQEFEDYGKQILTMSVLSIVLTAPLGAVFMELLGPRLLKKESALESRSERDPVIQPTAPKYMDYGACPPHQNVL